ncbi:MAG: hypothetical protein AAF203_01715 [Pseudomonadota bacterium]
MSRVQKQISAFIKSLLKKSSYTYADLAKVLNVSEPTIKRLMASGDFSLERIEVIATWFGLDAFDFISQAKSYKFEAVRISDKQAEVFMEHPVALYIMILLGTGSSLPEIRKKVPIPDKTYQKILLALERVGFIQLHGFKKVKILLRGPYRLPRKGPFKKQIKQAFDKRLADHFLYADESEAFRAGGEFYTSQSLQKKMQNEMADLVAKYEHLGRLEQELISPEKLEPNCYILYATSGDLWGPTLIQLERDVASETSDNFLDC